MRCLIQIEALNAAIQDVLKAISSKPLIPILSGIKIEARNDGILLTASDSEITIQRFIPVEQEPGKRVATIEEKGAIILPAKVLAELIRKMPGKELEIHSNEQFQAWIRAGKSEVQLLGFDPEDYPPIPQVDDRMSVTLPSEVLKSIIRQTIFASSVVESAGILTGTLWQWDEQQFTCVATDRHRLAKRTLHLDTLNSKQQLVLPSKTLSELTKLLPDQNQLISFICAEHQILFQWDNAWFYSRVLDGVYPDTSKIIPTQFKTEMVLPTAVLRDSIDRASLMSREEKSNVVQLTTLENQVIEISSSTTEIGKVTEKIELNRFNGESLKISFNSKFIMDVLRVIDSELVYIGFTGPMSPIIVKPEDETQLIHLILPYRTTGK